MVIDFDNVVHRPQAAWDANLPDFVATTCHSGISPQIARLLPKTDSIFVERTAFPPAELGDARVYKPEHRKKGLIPNLEWQH